jgi:hypothetical protein
MLTKLNLNSHEFDSVFDRLDSFEYELFFDEMYNVLPNIPRVKEILGTTKILAEGENWLIVQDLACEKYELLDTEELFPYTDYYLTIDDFRKIKY